MLTLIPAMSVAFAGNATLTAAFSAIRISEESEGAAMPYVRVTPIAAPRDVMYGGTGRATPQFQFDVIGKDFEAVRLKMAAFIGQWDSITLTLATGQLYDATRITDPMPLPGPLGKDESADTDVWGWTVTYSYATRT